MIATPPPRLSQLSIGWLAVGVALVGPWIWLVVLDRLLRKRRRPPSVQAR
jgi:hypothetical protein